jgi:hypothetical protein
MHVAGTAHVPSSGVQRFVLKITKDEKGALSATLYSIDRRESRRERAASAVHRDSGPAGAEAGCGESQRSGDGDRSHRSSFAELEIECASAG